MWIKESNRLLHLHYAILPGFLFTILFVAGLAVGMEFKDRQNGGKFDYFDIAATLIGGLIGQIIQVLLIILIIKLW